MVPTHTFRPAGGTRLPSPEVSYFAIALVFGVLFAVVSPPYATPDEPAHWGRAVAVAQGHLIERSPGAQVPDFHSIYDGLNAAVVREGGSLTPRRTLDVASRPLSCGLSPQGLHGASGYPPLPYILPAVVWSAACAVGGSFGAFLYAARIGNLILATLITVWAIRIIPFGKWLLFTLALLPMTLFQSASLSADSLTNAVVFLWLAYLAQLLTGGDKVSPRTQFFGVVVALSLVLCKPGYPLLLLPAALVGRARFRTTSEWLRFISMVVGAPIVLALVWTQAVSGLVPTRPGVDVAVNLAHLQTDPLDFVIALKRTLHQHVGTYWLGLVGVLGLMDVYLPRPAYVITTTLVAVSISLNHATRLPSGLVRATLLLVAGGSGALLAAALYVTYSVPESGDLEGLQGRYLLPLVAAALLALSFDARLWSRWRMWRAIIPCGAAIALALAVFAVGARYYSAPSLPDRDVARPYEGKLIQRASGLGREGGLFYVENGYRRYIVDFEWAQERGFDRASILTLSNAEFDAIPRNPEPLRSSKSILSSYEGKIVRRTTPGTDKESGWYLVTEGKRQWITDVQWMADRGLAPKDVLTIPDSDFDAIPENPEPLVHAPGK
jgi:uncharacterized membrane protein